MKSPDALRTISEVASDLELPQHVLRFWETRFAQIKPMKRGGGRRYYRPDDVDLLKGIRHLLYEEGYTIKGVQRLLKENGNRFVIAIGAGEDPTPYAAREVEVTEEVAENSEKEKVTTTEVGSVEARSVGELAGTTSRGKEKKLLGRLIRKDVKKAEPQKAELDDSIEALGQDDRKVLQSTLYELLECKRLLDQVR